MIQSHLSFKWCYPPNQNGKVSIVRHSHIFFLILQILKLCIIFIMDLKFNHLENHLAEKI